ncbi:MAG TPA: hypothetical protein VL335_03120 [Candidatus Paceibacterota bacterium]|jgi:hypothetical protein|nr:hypothetical protein [Candidatus Paceibacterota bacterium]
MKTRLIVVVVSDHSRKDRFIAATALELGFSSKDKEISPSHIKKSLIRLRFIQKKQLILKHTIVLVARSHAAEFKKIARMAFEMGYDHAFNFQVQGKLSEQEED